MQNELVTQRQQIELLNEYDEYSKKRISLHKVENFNTDGTHNRYEYHMVILDLNMTLNITFGENAIINLVNAMKK